MTIVLIALILYFAAAGLLVRAMVNSADAADSGSGRSTGAGWAWAAIPAIALHAGYHAKVAMQTAGGPDMHFLAALSLVGLGMAALTTLVGQRGRMAALGVVVFPLSALLLLCYHGYGHAPSPVLGWRLGLHAWLALLAYATLAVSALLAIMLWLQEHALRQRVFSGWRRALPPLTELETLLFRSITAGFLLLSLTLLTGFFFVQDLLAQKVLEKTVLSVLSWVVFGALLIGRSRYGWRGRKAVHWTLAAVILLALAYFGTKLLMM